MTQFVKNNTIAICATAIVIWSITAVVVLVVTGNGAAVRTIIITLTPIIPSLLTLLGVGQKVKETKAEVETVHEKIVNGDTTDVSS